MIHIFFALSAVALVGAFPSSGFSATPPASPQIDRKIKNHKQELEKLQQQIEGLEQERKKLKQDETILSTTLKRIETELEQSAKKQTQVKRKVLESESRIKKLSSQVNALSDEKSKWEQIVLADVGSYYVRSVYPQRLSNSHLQKLLSNSMLRQKFENLQGVEMSKRLAKEKEIKLIKSKENLIQVRAQLDSEIQKQKRVQAEKGELYKMTANKRAAAEQEVEKLKETAQSLTAMIGTLKKRREKERQKELASRKEEELERKDVEGRRGSLAWPVVGTITSNFGKQKHPELNITVINNGVKIRTERGAPIKAVEKGTVMFAADFRSYGQTVIVDHGGEFLTIYGLLGSILVSEGQKIAAGRVIGNAGSELQPQIYFEVRNEGHPENPIQWLK